MTQLIRISDRRHTGRQTYFTRPEMDRILSLYSRRVARGEWRDYALDLAPGMAVFSVFRHSQERALFSIAKRAEGTAGDARFFCSAAGSESPAARRWMTSSPISMPSFTASLRPESVRIG